MSSDRDVIWMRGKKINIPGFKGEFLIHRAYIDNDIPQIVVKSVENPNKTLTFDYIGLLKKGVEFPTKEGRKTKNIENRTKTLAKFIRK